MEHEVKRNAWLIKAHKRNCPAVRSVREGTWETPWFYEAEVMPHYKGKRGVRCIILRCNCTHCPALMELRTDCIEVLAHKELKP